MIDFVNNVQSFVNYTIFCELCNRMRFEVDCAKSHHRVISEGLIVIHFSDMNEFWLKYYRYLSTV